MHVDLVFFRDFSAYLVETSLLLWSQDDFYVVLNVEFEGMLSQILDFALPIPLIWYRRNVFPMIKVNFARVWNLMSVSF